MQIKFRVPIAQNSRLCFRFLFVNGIMLMRLLGLAVGILDLWLNHATSYTRNRCRPFVLLRTRLRYFFFVSLGARFEVRI